MWVILIIIAVVTLVLFVGLVLGVWAALACAGCLYAGSNLLARKRDTSAATHIAAERAVRWQLSAGVTAAVLLLLWVAFVPGAVPGLINPSRVPPVGIVLGTVIISALAFVLLAGVLVRGSKILRAISALTVMAPILVIGWMILWVYLISHGWLEEVRVGRPRPANAARGR